MTASGGRPLGGPDARGPFPSSHYSVIAAIGSDDPTARARALDTLIRAYYRPVYTYIRLRHRKDADAASDLLHGFFSQAMEREVFVGFDPSKARFRTYIKLIVDRFVVKAGVRERRLKRGAAALHVSIDLQSVESDLQALGSSASADEIERLFDREWLKGVTALAVDAFESHCAATGKLDRFRVFEKLALVDDDEERPSYAQVAAELGLKVTDVTNYLHFARKKLREIIVAKVRELSASQEEFESEVQAILGRAPHR